MGTKMLEREMAFKVNPEKHRGVDVREQIFVELNEQDHPSAKSLHQLSGKPSPSLWSGQGAVRVRAKAVGQAVLPGFLLVPAFDKH